MAACSLRRQCHKMPRVYELFPRLQCAPKGDMFKDFYAAYPRKVARAEAEKAFIQQVLKGFDPAEIIEGATFFAEYCRKKGTDRDFIPHPASWLRGERWADEEIQDCRPPSKEEIEAARDKADKLMKRGKYAVKYE